VEILKVLALEVVKAQRGIGFMTPEILLGIGASKMGDHDYVLVLRQAGLDSFAPRHWQTTIGHLSGASSFRGATRKEKGLAYGTRKRLVLGRREMGGVAAPEEGCRHVQGAAVAAGQAHGKGA